MELASILYAEVYFVCIIVIGLLLVWSLRSNSRSNSERWQIRMHGGFLLCFSVNMLFVLLRPLLLKTAWGVGGLYMLKSLYFLLLILGVYFWCGYAEAELRTERRGGRMVMLLFFLPFLLPAGIVAANLWTHGLFEITAAGEYRRHGLYHWFMLSLTVYSLLCCGRHFFRAAAETDPVRKSHMLLTASFPLSLILAWMISLLGETIPVVCVCVMVELLCTFVGASRQQISLDKLTQVNNRQNLISFMEYKLANHENRLFLLMIDLDDFKTINDTYGHLEGDNALIRLAKTLKRACAPCKRRPYIARYGGDEFIVVLEGTREEANTLCGDIQRILNEMQDPHAEYEMRVSIGLAECCFGMKPNELIAVADEELYKIKKERKVGR